VRKSATFVFFLLFFWKEKLENMGRLRRRWSEEVYNLLFFLLFFWKEKLENIGKLRRSRRITTVEAWWISFVFSLVMLLMLMPRSMEIIEQFHCN